jgi:agmatine deiminase
MHRRGLLFGAAAAFSVTGAPPAMARTPLYVPPEEAPHSHTFMMWPASCKVHPDAVFLEMLQETIATIANTISAFEPVIMLADRSDHARARRLLSAGVILWDIPTEDLWARDAGPLFAFQGDAMVVSHIQFNGWGKKQVHRRDGKVAARIAERLGLPIVPSGLRGEAGGVEHDGYGTMMAHESSWVNANRNAGQNRQQIEDQLLAAYGADTMIWSKGVYDEDITDYHIDSLARFTGPGRVLINLPDTPDARDPFHRAALDTYAALQTAGMTVDVIPEPTIRRVDTIDFVASYANYYACNGAILTAQFGDPDTDMIAVEALKRHYPNREIMTLNVDTLGEVGGGIHCATQQMPQQV